MIGSITASDHFSGKEGMMAAHSYEIIDVHLHAWWAGEGMECITNPDPDKIYDINEQVFSDTLAQMDACGIRCGVLCGPNNITLEWCRRAPGRFIPSWGPNPLAIEQEVSLFSQAIETQGFRGLGELIPQYLGLAPNDRRFFPLYRVCEERQLPVFLHTGLNGPDFPRWAPLFRVELCNPLLIEDILVVFPDLKIVMAHLSFPFTEQAAYMLLSHSNVYVDIACVNWYLGRAGFHRLLKQVIDLVGSDKILFGSDQMNVPQMMLSGVSAILEAPFLSEEEKRKILGENARKLLGISVPEALQKLEG
jgi:predicted TIM-barrel fold metal-dependent hydrolase